jgi:hypothetical protein
VYSVNDGVIKNIEPGFDRKKEKTPGERLDSPFNSAVDISNKNGSQTLEHAEESD